MLIIHLSKLQKVISNRYFQKSETAERYFKYIVFSDFAAQNTEKTAVI